ncbi:asparaginase [Owenweeksia hongkongensis DSM 17368]|uniref:Isoaspartyl peptidase n=1 Tax=Owenweeksia hongkongensis (strain DSM 17368 / CIP 108786 / JCM 12287 / NRRL B-23963 / UST20020801) TaxID=926562 RepID=G8R847_OWEHD|nr:isoaspartyl peptidase/L-asparaginase [Owenweeksia hongkongensis]AEV32415.1 asparaginase [Owenweeksia hongkongensis DSM 17368]
MKGVFIGVLLLFVAFAQAQDYVIVLHGGAGNGIKKENINTEEQEAYELKMSEALFAGAKVLDTGGAAHLAVVEVIKVLEDSPLFNAGKGAVFTYDERNEMDASIMDGNTLNAGAVAGIGTVKNPITAALAVMQNSPHVILSGKGAEDFAKLQGCEIVSEDYFKTEKRLKSLERYKKAHGSTSTNWEDSKMGTVGCAVLDKNGNLAAGTSTGGMTGKRYGRIGDSPIIGAGTHADNNTCALSCTGHGEYFIRYAVAHDVSARMEYGNESFQNAASAVIHKVLKPAGGDGGLIGVDKDGNVVMEFNTSGMFRAYLKEGQEAVVEMF